MALHPLTTAYTHATIVTVNKQREVILDGAIVTLDNKIDAIGKTSEILKSLRPDTKIIDCAGKIIIPGLVNTHAHLAQSLLRGLAEDLPLHSWLCDAIWPLEANYAHDDGYVAALLTISEMLLSGTTCFLEAMLTHRSGIENVVKAVEETGIRACLGKLVKSIETKQSLNITDARDRDASSMSIESALAAHQSYHGLFNNRLHIWMAAGTPRGSTKSAHAAIGAAAHAHDMGITMHCAEAPADLTIYQSEYGCSPLEFCRDTRLIGPKTVLAHVVHPKPETDYKIMNQSGTTMSHNPTSNCKLGSGISPVPDMLNAEVNVALGTDGAPCNNTYDMFREMHLAAILHAGSRQMAGVMNAYQVLEMATINGARALGLESDIGSLEAGKKADLVVVSPSRLHAAPWDVVQLDESDISGIDPITMLVHSCTGADVDMVVVDGRALVEKGKLLSHAEESIAKRAKISVQGIRQRAGVGAKNRMRLKYS